MNNYFSLFGKLYEKDSVTTVCVIVLIVIAVAAVWLYRKHNRADNSPDLLDYDGYYKIALTPTGYARTDRNNLFRTLDSFCYLRKDPFSIEVAIDTIETDNGKKYRALAVAMVVLPEDRIDFVCRKYFSNAESGSSDVMAAVMKSRNSTDSTAADILLEQRIKDRNISSDEMLKQILNGNTHSSSGRERRQKKTNCDADIDADLTIAFSSTLKKLVREHGGAMTNEELKKKFLGQAMLAAMSAGHAVTEIPVFNIIEIMD